VAASAATQSYTLAPGKLLRREDERARLQQIAA
jgi:hypothetical protein